MLVYLLYECLDMQEAGFKDKVHIAFDSASSEFFDGSSGTYNLGFKSENPNDRKCSRFVHALFAAQGT